MPEIVEGLMYVKKLYAGIVTGSVAPSARVYVWATLFLGGIYYASLALRVGVFSNLRQKNVVVSPVQFGSENDCVGEDDSSCRVKKRPIVREDAPHQQNLKISDSNKNPAMSTKGMPDTERLAG
jgi:hypothetical protein